MRVSRTDTTFLILLVALLAIGLVMLTSASMPLAYQRFGDAFGYLKRQALVGLLPGIILFVIFARTDYRFWRTQALPLFVASIALLLLVFVPGIGAPWGTARSWIHLFGFSLQPVEIVKLTFLIYLAALLEGRSERGLAPFLIALGAVSLLIMLQPDLGNLIVIVGIAGVAYLTAGAPWRHIVGLATAGMLGVFGLIMSSDYRRDRLLTFLRPDQDFLGSGYHIRQAFLAIGSGGLFGVGLGHSRQKYAYLPETIGDSIVAVMAEELGFALMLAFLAALLAFILRGLRIAERAPDAFGRCLAAGIMAWVFVQAFCNIGSMIGILPLTGLAMPFMSQGGTALAALLAAMGIMINIASQSPDDAADRRRL